MFLMVKERANFTYQILVVIYPCFWSPTRFDGERPQRMVTDICMYECD